MYAIRVRPGNQVLEATLSGAIPTAEALRAVSQASVLAEAGAIQRVVADVSAVTDAPDLDVVAAALGPRLEPALRLAIVCSAAQLPAVRRLATLASARSNFGVFTRAADAEAWLGSNPGQRLPQTSALHLRAQAPATNPRARTRKTGAA